MKKILFVFLVLVGAAAAKTACVTGTFATTTNLLLPLPAYNQCNWGSLGYNVGMGRIDALFPGGILSVARGGTATATPGLVAGTNITITGTWPNQTVNSTGGGEGAVDSVFGQTGVVPNLSGDISTSGSSVTTLPTVNSNVGTFSPSSVTVNGKGQVTAASAATAANIVSRFSGCSGQEYLGADGACHFLSAVINVKSSPYNAVGDAKRVVDGVTVNGSHTVTSATAVFVNSAAPTGDVGKIIWCQNVSDNPVKTLAQTTITAVNSSTSITVAGTANDSISGSECVYATQDDTAAFQAAVTAASAPGSFSPNFPGVTTTIPASVYVPPGAYVITDRIYNINVSSGGLAPSIIGDPQSGPILYLSSSFTANVDGTGALINAGGVSNVQFSNFTVSGVGYLFQNFASGQDLIRIRATVFTVSQVQIYEFGSTAPGGAIAFNSSTTGQINNVTVQNGVAASSTTACVFNAANLVSVVAILCSNYPENLSISNSLGRTPTTTALNFFGGLIDECGTGASCTTIRDGSTNANFYGTNLWNGSATALAAAVTIDATSKAWFHDIGCGAFNSANNISCMAIASGGTAYVGSSTLRGNASGVAVQNAGTFVDLGGNVYQNCTGTSCAAATLAQSFSGNNPTGRPWQGCGSRGLGDGTNAIAGATYLQFACVNDTGQTIGISGFHCYTDNAGTSTANLANNAGTSFLTGAVTCNNTKASGGAAGTQSATKTLAPGDAVNFTFVLDGTSKQVNSTVSGFLFQ